MSKVQSKEVDMDQPNKQVNEPAKKDAIFPVSELLENSQKLFGYYPEVLEAALVGKGEHAEMLSVSDAKRHISDFLKKEVK